MEAVPTSQEKMVKIFNTHRPKGKKYKKITPVRAWPGEDKLLVTMTASGEETRRMVPSTDMIIENPTGANYGIDAELFSTRYLPDPERPGWYIPNSSIWAVEVTEEIIAQLPGNKYMAGWGEVCAINLHDFIAVALPQEPNVYRIDRTEFFATMQEF